MSESRPSRAGELSKDGKQVRVPLSGGKRTFYGLFGAFGLLSLLAPLLYDDLSGDDLSTFMWFLVPGAFLGLVALYKIIFDPYEWAPTPEEQSRLAEATRKAAEEPDPLFEAKWYIRYPIAVAGGWLFIAYVLPGFGAEWSWAEWLIVGAALIAVLALTREVSIWLLGLGALALIINWLSGIKITVPGAIIIGAVIIAYAIHTSRKS